MNKTILIMFLTLLCANSFAEVSKQLQQRRAENASRWEECKKAYKSYVESIRPVVKANKKVSNNEFTTIEKKVKPYLEELVICQNDNLYTEQEYENILGASYCLNFYKVMPTQAKSTGECTNLMKKDSF